MTMTKLRHSIEIEAPASVVFKFVEDPNKLWPLDPSGMEVSDEKITTEGLGSTYQLSYKMLGMRFSVEMTRTDQVVDSLIEEKSPVGGTYRWLVDDEGDYTRLTLEFDFTTPVPFLDKALMVTVGRHTDEEIKEMLSAIKAELER